MFTLKSRKLKAFSLVEMIVMLGVMSLLMTLIIIYSVKGEKAIILFRDQAKVVNAIVRTKSLAIASFGQSSDPGAPAVPCGYGIHFDANGAYFIFAKQDPSDAVDCHTIGIDYQYTPAPGGKDTKVQSFSLDTNVLKFTDLGATDIVFIPPNPDVKIITPVGPLPLGVNEAIIELSIADGSKQVKIKVNTFGQISTQ